MALIATAASRCSLPPVTEDDPKDRYRSRLAAGAVCCSTSRTVLCGGIQATVGLAFDPGEAFQGVTPATLPVLIKGLNRMNTEQTA